MYITLFVLIGLGLSAQIGHSIGETCVPSSYTSWVQLNISVFRPNEWIDVNLSSLGISCNNVNCTDIALFDSNCANLTLSDGRLAWQIPLDNTTSRNKPNNDFVGFVPQNSSTTYWLAWNGTDNNTGGSYILSWEDNYERYAIGAQPLKVVSGNAKVVCSISPTNKGTACSAAPSAPTLVYNLSTFRNFTAVYEYSASSTTTNFIYLDHYNSDGSSSYRIPQYVSPTFRIQDGSINNYIGDTMPSISGGFNITTGRINNTVYFEINYGARANGTSTGTMKGDKIEINQGTSLNLSLLSFRFFNGTYIQIYNNTNNITVSSIQTRQLNSCTPTTNWNLNLADNCTISWYNTVIGNWKIYSTGRGLSSIANSNFTAANITYGPFVDFAYLVYLTGTKVTHA